MTSNFSKKLFFAVFISLFAPFSLLKAQWVADNTVVPDGNGGFMVAVDSATQLPSVMLREFTVSSLRYFFQADDLVRYNRYRRAAASVHTYAIEAVKTYRNMEAATKDMKRRDRKKYIAQLEDELESKFRKQMKNLSKTQGLLLTKMIEKELHMPFYSLVKDIKGGFTAFYWNEFGKMYGYHLKDGYERGKDPVLDAVLNDYDFSNIVADK